MTAIRIFISSPGDVAEERALARRVIDRLQVELAGRAVLEPIVWEHEPLLATAGFQEQIVDPAEADVVVCILWTRLGTRLPETFKREDGSRYASGTEYEFEQAQRSFEARGRPRLLVYRRMAELQVSLEDEAEVLRRLEQKKALTEFVNRRFFSGRGTSLIVAFHPYTVVDDFEQRFEQHLRKVLEDLVPAEREGAGPATAAVALWAQGSPYRGLHPFEFEHAPAFFGRTRAIAEVLAALRQQAAEGRAFVLVLGSSGGGKSSLVRAGVLPMLTQPGVVEGVAHWRRAVFRYSERPGDLLDGLASALVAEEALPELDGEGAGAELARVLRESATGAAVLIKQALARVASELGPAAEGAEPPAARLVLVVDQMEEIFTLEGIGAEDRRTFLAVLDALARSGEVWVVATLRSEFYPRCAELEALVALKEGAGQYDLMPPTPAEIGQMIRLPARAAGLRFEEDATSGERLDDVLHDAAARNPGALPLLQFTLEELYQRRAGARLLTFASYRLLGGLEGALTGRAEEVFQRLPTPVQDALPAVLGSLVRVGRRSGEGVGRQPSPWQEVAATAEARALVEAFVEARLLATELAPDGTVTVSVVHEALLRHWPRVEAWLEENRESLRLRGRMVRAAERWAEEGRKPDRLLRRGRPLEEAHELLERGIDPGPEGSALIAASLARARRLRAIKGAVVALLVVLAVVAGGAAYLADRQRARAEQEAQTAERTTEFLVDLFRISDPGEARGSSITARELLDRGAERIGEELADQPRTRAALMSTIGRVYYELGLYGPAEPLLEQALAIREGEHGEGHLAVASSLTNLGALSLRLGRYAEAEPLFQRALEIRERTLGAEDPAVADSLHDLSVLHGNRGDYARAEALARRAVTIQERVLGPDAPTLAGSLDHLAILYREQGRDAEAEPLALRALEIRERTLLPDHPDVALSLNNLAIFYAEQERFDEAEGFFRRALEIRERTLGPDHHRVASTLGNLGETYRSQGRLAEAEPLFERALTIVEKSLGSGHSQVAVVLTNLGNVYREKGELAEAEAAFQRAIAIFESVLPEHPIIAHPLHGLATVYGDQRRYAEAEPLFQRALGIREQALGPEDSATRETLAEYAALLRATGRDGEAEALAAPST